MKPVHMLALGAVVAALAYTLWRGGIREAAAGAAGAVVDVAEGAIAGTVEGIGGVVGVPKTDMSECERAKAEGRTLDASFACPAKDFLKYWWNK